MKKEQLGKEVSVVARLSDVEDSPAIAEKAFGKGRVVGVCDSGRRRLAQLDERSELSA